MVLLDFFGALYQSFQIDYVFLITFMIYGNIFLGNRGRKDEIMEKDMVLQEESEEQKVQGRRKKNKNKKIWINILIVILSISFWGTAVYYGYHYAKDYIDTAIKNVQQENALNIQALTERIESLSQEIHHLRDSIENTDSTISNSTEVQERIDEKLEALDDQLKTLERSLQILKEAPNVQN